MTGLQVGSHCAMLCSPLAARMTRRPKMAVACLHAVSDESHDSSIRAPSDTHMQEDRQSGKMEDAWELTAGGQGKQCSPSSTESDCEDQT